MRLMLAQYGGYGSGIAAILGLIVLVAMAVAIGGIVVVIWRRIHESSSPIWRPMLLWCIGVLGALYGIYWLAALMLIGNGRSVFDETIDKWVAAGVLVAVLGFLPGVFVERAHPGWGAGWMALLATLFAVALLFMRSLSSDIYAWTLYGLAAGVLLPLWLAALSIWWTAPRPKGLRYTTRDLLMVLGIAAACFGTLGAVVHNAYFSDAREQQRIGRMMQESEDARNAAIEKLDELVEAAEGSDDRDFELAKAQFLQLLELDRDPFCVMAANGDAISSILDRIETTTSTQARKELLCLLASPEMWNKGHNSGPGNTSRVVAIVRDTNQSIPVRRAATQVLLNWGNWHAATSVLFKLPDRTKIGPAVVEFIVAASADPNEQYRFRAVAKGSEQVIHTLPRIMPRRDDCLPALIALLNHPCPWCETVEAAAQTVGNLGAAGRPALPALRVAATSNYPSLSRYAKRSIAQIEQFESRSDPLAAHRTRSPQTAEGDALPAQEPSERSQLPDLEVVDVFLHNGSYLRARVRNNGAMPATGASVRFETEDLTGNFRGLTLGPGQVGVATSGRSRPGTHVVKVTVDPDNVVSEADELNNTMEVSLTWLEK
ncbi:hypothetical protein NG895_22330 [Aeoliella sp. ICT_H6.2]|uniref:CARDB domain-containing protein n=1 Tax=Aeoliella straminimaris TaxID=2954799 RepID=A0A9X2FEM4_9BACT|nr:CARDB domain-containing protein [Aeoliella straminimaris]MCO6046642.1 hypothetical protein [Aeoliella straminimaris]